MTYNPSTRTSQTSKCEICLQIKTWFFWILVVVCCTEWTKLHSLVSSLPKSFASRVQCCNDLSHFVNVLVSIIFHVTEMYCFQILFCTFSKCSLRFTHCRVNLCFFSFARIFKPSSRLCIVLPCRPKSCWVNFFCFHSWKCTMFFFGIFFFFLLHL